MKTIELLEKMEANACGPEFDAAVREYYSKDSHGGPCSDLEAEYDSALKGWAPLMEDNHFQDLYKQLIHTYEANRDYAARYGFKCGITGALRQVYSANSEPDGGFHRLLVEDLLVLPGMKRHDAYYSRLTLIHNLETSLSSILPAEASEDLTSIECTLSNRVYHAAISGFSIGYMAGFKLIGDLDPVLAAMNLHKLRTVEYTLQFNLS